jgi:hypothetical protein
VTAVAISPATLQSWLDRLIETPSDDRRSLSIEGLDHGLALERVTCVRCDEQALNWTSALRHLERTEFTHRKDHGPDARLHQPGDLVPAVPEANTRPCGRRGCNARVIWAATSTGSRVPLDPEPDPAGTVVLVEHPGGGDVPLAMFVHTDAERLTTPPAHLFRRHASTCRGKAPR